MDRLDAKAIIMETDGEWTIKEEEAGTGESGDGDGRRRSLKPSRGKTQESSIPRSGAASPMEIERTAVIELDDD